MKERFSTKELNNLFQIYFLFLFLFWLFTRKMVSHALSLSYFIMISDRLFREFPRFIDG